MTRQSDECSIPSKVEAPGPGAYQPGACNDLASRAVTKGAGPSAAFRSKAARSPALAAKSMLGRPPGPAFYSPHLPIGHRSFHFGAVLDSFVPAGASMSDLDASKQRGPVKQ